MKDAKRHQRSLLVALLDLKNAFGEVSHDLIRLSLKYHHIPDNVINLFNNIYKDSYVRVTVNNENSNPIKVCRGVLQGDPCSPLLFNISFNSLMLTIKRPEFEQAGYLWSTSSTSKVHRSWLQFADDALLVSYNDKNLQVLLNIFQAWCEWAGMLIRRDKCSCFGMRKENQNYLQYPPAVFINGLPIPTTDVNHDFIYLGKHFNFNLSNDNIKSELKIKLASFIFSSDLMLSL